MNKLLDKNKIFIIAEIGKNFIQSEEEKSVEEYLENAKKLVDAAVKAGVDAVKFQTHELEDEQLEIYITSPHFKEKDRYSWVKRNTSATPEEKFWKPLKEYCDNKNVVFFSTPMSKKAAEKINRTGVPFWKVGSGDIEDYVLLDYITYTEKPIIISSGMVSFEELDRVVDYIESKNCPVVIMYCISKYPAPKNFFNLGTIEHLRERYPNATIGFSDHSIGHEVTLGAIKLGALVIEKHFSFSRDLWGADHKVSMTPEEMAQMISAIRNQEYENVNILKYYGKKDKELEGAKNEFRPFFKKAFVAGVDISKGEIIQMNMLYAMRPLKHIDGIESKDLSKIIGKKTKKTLKKYEPIKTDFLD